MESRLKQLSDLSTSVSDIEIRYKQILHNIDWTEDALHKNHHKLKKPVDVNPDDQNTTTKHITTKNIEWSSIWLLPREEKLKLYEKAVSQQHNSSELTETNFPASMSVTKDDHQMSFSEMNKFKRDLKRRRMKYRTTTAPPLSHTEEMRALIELQMESIVAKKPIKKEKPY